MVSALWKASSEGDLHKVLEAFNDATATVDIELKDHTGVTALIEAVRNGHVEIVKVLLEKGADPFNSSSFGPPAQYTSNTAILELLQNAQPRVALDYSNQPVYPVPGAENPEKQYYPPPPPETYTYYPTINPSLSTVNEAGAYYPPSSGEASPNSIGNLPPPEVARMIPCRYFPACRYGAQCMFAHPQTPYFQPPMPPQYPPYESMGNPYVPQYYQPPPSFQQPPSAHPMSPMSPPPGPPVMHARSPSDVMSPPMGHFNSNGAPPPPSAPYGHLSPPIYPHPNHVPMGMQPIPPLASIPPLHQHAPHPNVGPHPHPNLYNASTSPVPPFPLPQDASGQYPMPPPPANINYPDTANGVKPENGHVEIYNNHTNHPNHREGMNGHRRGSGRRPSFSARKPPCLFFPSGRCKNGDDCRFPHVLPENGAPMPHHAFPVPRPGPPRPRGPMNGPNGFHNLEAKLGNMAIRDDQRQKNGAEGSSRSHSSEAGNRPKFNQGGKHPNNGINGHAKQKVQTFRHQQRVPNADEFPVLSGSTTPPTRTPTNGLVNGSALNGPTAAQVLQAPPPARKESKESSTRGNTPDPVRIQSSTEPKVDAIATDASVPAPQQEQVIVNNVNKLPPMSFAAAATSGTADVSKEVSVSA